MVSTWNQAAEESVRICFGLVRRNPKVDLGTLSVEVDRFITSLWAAPGGNDAAKTAWANLGATSIEVATKYRFQINPVDVFEMLIDKQNDYGPNAISRFGRQGIMVRTHDKVARLLHLYTNGATPANESFHDSFMDLVGYSVLGVMWESRTFLLPMEPRQP